LTIGTNKNLRQHNKCIDYQKDMIFYTQILTVYLPKQAVKPLYMK